MIRAGKLRHHIMIERVTTTIAADGTPTEVWMPIAVTRAELVESTTEEHQRNHGTATEMTVTFRLRFIAGVSVADRIVDNAARRYDVKAIIEIGRRRGLEIRCLARGL